MAVWLTHGSCTVGLDDGVIRAGDFAVLVPAFRVASTIDAERDRALAAARAQSEVLLADARVRANALLAEAKREHDEGMRLGLAQGLEEAAAEWFSQAIEAGEARRRGLLRQSERLSDIVTMAVERVIAQEDRAALFRRSLHTISRLLNDAPLLTLRVAEADLDSARRAVDELVAQAGAAPPIEIAADAEMAVGGCRFESERGVVDASLQTQLEALRRAITRAAREVERDVDVDVLSNGDAGPPGVDLPSPADA
jgi:type III secretion protein L